MAGCGSRCNTARSRRHDSGCRGTYAQYVALGKKAACNLYSDVKRRQAIRQRAGVMIDRRGPGAPGNRSTASRSRNWRKRAACIQGRRKCRSTRPRRTDVGRRLTPNRVKLRRMLTWTPRPTPNPRRANSSTLWIRPTALRSYTTCSKPKHRKSGPRRSRRWWSCLAGATLSILEK